MKQIAHSMTPKNIRICPLISFCLFFNSLAAQLSVQEEPFHKVIFENEYVRLIDGRIPARDTTLLHNHTANSVVVFLSHSTFGIQDAGEKGVITTIHPGDMVYRAYGDKPVNHTVWNQGNGVFHFMVVELKKQAVADTCSQVFQPGIKLQWEEKSVRAYTLGEQEGGYCHISASSCVWLLICVTGIAATDASPGKHIVPPGGFIFFPTQSGIKIRATKEKLKCVLLQLK